MALIACALLVARAGLAGAQPARFALLLSGKVGSIRGGCASCADGFASKQHEPPGASARLIAYVAKSHMQHVVRANAALGVDVFVHTWNPEAGLYIDQQYGDALRLSLHQPVESIASGRSFALSIGRGGRLVRAYEDSRGGTEYQSVLVMRYDAYVIAPLQLAPFESGSIYLDALCCAGKRTPTAKKYIKAACAARGLGFGRRAQLLSDTIPCRVSIYKGVRDRGSIVDNSYFTKDWFFAAPSRIVESWLEIAANWKAHTCWAKVLGFTSDWSHHR
jgi:hypothetical protein